MSLLNPYLLSNRVPDTGAQYEVILGVIKLIHILGPMKWRLPRHETTGETKHWIFKVSKL